MADAATRAEPAKNNGESPRGRRMFCLKNDKVLLAPQGAFRSHLEWFHHERWISDNGNDEKFFNHLVVGSYLPQESSLYCFHEVDFSFDKDVVDVVSRNIFHLKQLLNLQNDTKVFLGPEDNGKFVGTVAALLKKARKGEPEIRSGG